MVHAVAPSLLRKLTRRGRHERSPVKTRGFASVVGRLTGANSLIVVLAFVTSPILARALGPSGRGELAAIFVVLGLAPSIADIGLYVYVTRERSRQMRGIGSILGSTVPIALTAAMVGVLLAVPIADALGRGRRDVVLFIELGLFLLPFTVFCQTLYGVVVGAQRWAVVMVAKFISAGGPALVIVTLSLTDSLSVSTVATAYLACSVLGYLPFLVGLRGSRPWRFRSQIAREGLAFGSRTWLSSLATQTNVKLDQLLMAALASSHELGLYALAVTLATASTSLTGAIGTVLLPRVAAGEPLLAARACRMTILIVGAYGVALALVSPLVVPVVFGSAFSGSIAMLVVLLAANMLLVPGQVLGSALIAAGEPGAVAHGQLCALAITVPALIVVLPVAGGVGAAAVSLVSYAASFVVVLVAALRRFELPPRAFLLIDASDLRWIRSRLRRSATRAPGAASSV
jgi:O-antigen/teichoic acid export membrane protein